MPARPRKFGDGGRSPRHPRRLARSYNYATIEPGMKQIIGIGAEGHAAVLIELIEQAGAFNVNELLNDDDFITARNIRGVGVCAATDCLPRLAKELGIRVFFM